MFFKKKQQRITHAEKMQRVSALLQRYGSWSAVTKACDRNEDGVYVLTRHPDGTPIRKTGNAPAVAPAPAPQPQPQPAPEPVVEQPAAKSLVNPPDLMDLIRKTPRPELPGKKAQPFKPK